MVDADRHVLEGGGPAPAAAQPEPAVLEVPNGPAAPGEVGGERFVLAAAVAGAPEAAVDQDGDRPRRLAFARKSELAELIPPPAVGMNPRLDDAYNERSLPGA
jgi:hypothetical protein